MDQLSFGNGCRTRVPALGCEVGSHLTVAIGFEEGVAQFTGDGKDLP